MNVGFGNIIFQFTLIISHHHHCEHYLSFQLHLCHFTLNFSNFMLYSYYFTLNFRLRAVNRSEKLQSLTVLLMWIWSFWVENYQSLVSGFEERNNEIHGTRDMRLSHLLTLSLNNNYLVYFFKTTKYFTSMTDQVITVFYSETNLFYFVIWL